MYSATEWAVRIIQMMPPAASPILKSRRRVVGGNGSPVPRAIVPASASVSLMGPAGAQISASSTSRPTQRQQPPSVGSSADSEWG